MIELALMLIGSAMVAFAALELWLSWYEGDSDDGPRRGRPGSRGRTSVG